MDTPVTILHFLPFSSMSVLYYSIKALCQCLAKSLGKKESRIMGTHLIILINWFLENFRSHSGSPCTASRVFLPFPFHMAFSINFRFFARLGPHVQGRKVSAVSDCAVTDSIVDRG